jgi:response regulator RpfG family c-di-GMP phosphodiesterase
MDKVLLCQNFSGYSEQEAIQHFTEQGLSGFIQKPYQLKQLLHKVPEILTLREKGGAVSGESQTSSPSKT